MMVNHCLRATSIIIAIGERDLEAVSREPHQHRKAGLRIIAARRGPDAAMSENGHWNPLQP